MENKIIATPINDEETVLSLPIKKKQLGEFISSLLGQQQSIERNIEEKFDIDHAWLMNLHEMISQRIHQQANAHLTYFSSIIYFREGLKRTFTSVEAFETYSENKKLLPIGIKIIWIYLVHFPLKNYPEKQQITFSAQIHSNREKNNSVFLAQDIESIAEDNERSSINYQIDHTERTWGDDIEVIISNQVNSVLKNKNVKDIIFDFCRLSLILVILLYCFVSPFYIKISNNRLFIEKQSEYYSTLKVEEENDIVGVSKKIDYLAEIAINTIGSKDLKGLCLLVCFFVVGPVISIFVLVLTEREIHSFIVLSKEAEKYREKKLQREKRSVLILITSFLLSVLSGIIGNYGFAWLTR